MDSLWPDNDKPDVDEADSFDSEDWKSSTVKESTDSFDYGDISDYECNCEAGPDDDHDGQCELWFCWDYVNGWANWDHWTNTLVEVNDDDFLGVRPPKRNRPYYYNGPEDEFDSYDENPGSFDNPTDKAIQDAFDGIEEKSFQSGSGCYVKQPDGSWMKEATTKSTVLSNGPVLPVWKKCRHYQQEMWLPNGVAVYPSSHYWHGKNDTVPDLGVYLDGCWEPDCLAFHLGTPDYGIPVPAMSTVLHVAREALRVASEGGFVEVGCIGGHGRTGLFLGVLTLLAAHEVGVPLTAKDAIEYVRSTYCRHAIESSKQEWYLVCIAAELRGEAHPAVEPLIKIKPKPKPVPPKVISYKSDAFGASKANTGYGTNPAKNTATNSVVKYVGGIVSQHVKKGV